MNDRDTEIRRAVHELVEAAPPAPPFPHVETVAGAPRPRRRPVGILVAAIAIAVAVAVIGGVLVIDRTASDDAPVATGAPLPRARVITCAAIVGSAARLSAGQTAVLGRVGLPTRRPLQANPMPRPRWRRFAKNGLLVQRAKPFELIIPETWRAHARISWGQSPLTARLRVQGCPASTPGEKWLAFAGGFHAERNLCLPLIVKTATQQRRVRIGIGTQCPGQTAPVPAPVG
jgi:hypothetical protein